MQSNALATSSSKHRIVLSGIMLLSSIMSSLIGFSVFSLVLNEKPAYACVPDPALLLNSTNNLLLQQAEQFRSDTTNRENLLQLVGILKQISASSSCDESLTLIIRSYNAYVFANNIESREYSKLAKSISEKCRPRSIQDFIKIKKSHETILSLKRVSLIFSQDTSDKSKLMNVIGVLIPFTRGASRPAAIELIVRSYNAFIFGNKKEGKDYLRMVDQLAAS